MVTLGEEWTFISWDYRGFFSSDHPRRLRNVSVRDHAMDGLEVFKAALRGGPDCEPLPGYEHIAHDDTAIETMAADLVLGHSMGVQVALEFSLLYPDRCNSLALYNGTSGHALQSGLQPTLQVPYLGDMLSSLLSVVLRDDILDWYGWFLESVRAFVLKPMIAAALRVYVNIFGSRTLSQILGPNYMVEFTNSYLGGICMDHKSLSNFLRGFQELDAHSCTHLLWQVRCPVLLVAGLWDVLTPCRCMARISKLVNGPCRLVVDMYSTHSTLLEHPERALGELQHFVEVVLPRWNRKDSYQFEQLREEVVERPTTPNFGGAPYSTLGEKKLD
jgi:pimeloyl-ACP methyl ester carboxylesterase